MGDEAQRTVPDEETLDDIRSWARGARSLCAQAHRRVGIAKQDYTSHTRHSYLNDPRYREQMAQTMGQAEDQLNGAMAALARLERALGQEPLKGASYFEVPEEKEGDDDGN